MVKISCFSDPTFRQYWAAGCWNLAGLNLGVFLGWPAVTTPIFESTSTPLVDRPITDEDIAFSTSLPFLAGILFSFVWGYIANRFGRKITGYLTGLCYILCYALILNTCSVDLFILSRIIGGAAYCGVLFNGPMYIAEISETSKVGRLSATYLISENFGIFLIYILGSVLSYRDINLFCVVFSTFSTIMLIFFPESPVYYLKYDLESEAKKSLQWYRPKDETYLTNELNRLNETFVLTKKIEFKHLFTKHTMMATIIGLYLQWGIQTTGINYITMSAVFIFQQSSNIMDPYLSTIIIGLVNTIGPCVYFYLTNKFGRKSMMFVSYCILSTTMTILGAYFYYIRVHRTDPLSTILKCVPVICLAIYFLGVSSGAGIIPFTLYSEIFSSEVRNTVIPFIYIWNGFSNFLVMQFVSTYLYHVAHMYGIFWFFGICTGISALFTAIFVPETKDKSFPKIMEELTNKACW